MKNDKAIKNMIEPWPISPNITPKKKGKLMHVKTAGLASLYEGTPYVSIINWKVYEKSFVLKNVGGINFWKWI